MLKYWPCWLINWKISVMSAVSIQFIGWIGILGQQVFILLTLLSSPFFAYRIFACWKKKSLISSLSSRARFCEHGMQTLVWASLTKICVQSCILRFSQKLVKHVSIYYLVHFSERRLNPKILSGHMVCGLLSIFIGWSKCVKPSSFMLDILNLTSKLCALGLHGSK